MKPRRHRVLSPFQEDLLFGIAETFPQLVFVGGTALAEFYLAHRRSDDLDFAANSIGTIAAAEGPVTAFLRRKRLRVRPFVPIRGAFVVHVAPQRGDPVKLEFFTTPHLEPREVRTVEGVRVPTARHLADLKWRAFPREDPKDLYDLTALARHGVRRPWPREIPFAAAALAAAKRSLDAWTTAPPERPGWFPGSDSEWRDRVDEMTDFLHAFLAEATDYLRAA